MPSEYGKGETAYKRYRLWCDDGRRPRILEVLDLAAVPLPRLSDWLCVTVGEDAVLSHQPVRRRMARLELLFLVARTGHPRQHSLRTMANALLYVLRTGCAWRLLPAD